MKFLKESINSISKEGAIFIQEHPNFADYVKAFEEEYDITDTLLVNEEQNGDFVNLFTSDVYLHYEREGLELDYEDFGDAEITEASYYVDKENNLCIEARLEWNGEGTQYSDWDRGDYYNPPEWRHETSVDASANVWINLTIPKDIKDWQGYKTTGEDDIEYEVD